MKKNLSKACLMTLLAVAGAAFLATTARAQGTPTYNDMDALFGFRVISGTGTGTEGIINLGQVSQFDHTFTLSLGNIGSFMSTNFGSDWFTRQAIGQAGATAIQWAVIATDASTNFTNDLWTTRDPGIRPTPWTGGDQAVPSGAVDGVGTQYTHNTIAPGTTSAIVQQSGQPNTWTSWQPGGPNSFGISWAFFNPTDEGNTNTVMAFDFVQPNQDGVQTGLFSWSSDGTVTFTVIPEPGTYRLMALGTLGLLGLMILRRRRVARA
jgi:hypothetical protein